MRRGQPAADITRANKTFVMDLLDKHIVVALRLLVFLEILSILRLQVFILKMQPLDIRFTDLRLALHLLQLELVVLHLSA